MSLHESPSLREARRTPGGRVFRFMGSLAVGLALLTLAACGGTAGDAEQAGAARQSAPHETGPGEALRLYQTEDRPVFLDVREKWELARYGSIPGIVHIPMGELGERLGELDPEHPVVIVCRSGRRSRIAGQTLLREGFAEVHNLAGGMLTWDGPRSGGS